MDRRIAVEDIEDALKQQLWYLFPDRYRELFLKDEIPFFDPETGETTMVSDNEEEEVVDDLDELDAYFEKLERGEKQSMNGAQMMGLLVPDREGWL